VAKEKQKSPPISGEGHMCNMPAWVQYLQALATPAIALLAIVIGVLQWVTARQRIVLDLFDRRMLVYEEINAVFSEVIREGNATMKVIFSFDRAAARAPHLFGNEVTKFLQETRKRMVALRYAEIKANSDNDEIRGKAADLAAKHMMDLTGFSTEFASLVQPYVKMHQKVCPIKIL
jgi:hypothetical protein